MLAITISQLEIGSLKSISNGLATSPHRSHENKKIAMMLCVCSNKNLKYGSACSELHLSVIHICIN